MEKLALNVAYTGVLNYVNTIKNQENSYIDITVYGKCNSYFKGMQYKL